MRPPKRFNLNQAEKESLYIEDNDFIKEEFEEFFRDTPESDFFNNYDLFLAFLSEVIFSWRRSQKQVEDGIKDLLSDFRDSDMVYEGCYSSLNRWAAQFGEEFDEDKITEAGQGILYVYQSPRKVHIWRWV